MTETTELHARLLADARSYDPAAYPSGLLAPYRDVMLIWRAKFMSYEQIAATLGKHGIRVSHSGVGVFCRRSFTKAVLDRARREQFGSGERSPVQSREAPVRPAESAGGKRGPKVARDDY